MDNNVTVVTGKKRNAIRCSVPSWYNFAYFTSFGLQGERGIRRRCAVARQVRLRGKAMARQAGRQDASSLRQAGRPPLQFRRITSVKVGDCGRNGLGGQHGRKHGRVPVFVA